MKKSRKERREAADKKKGVYIRVISEVFQSKLNLGHTFATAQKAAITYINNMIKKYPEEAHLIRQAARGIRTIGYH